MENPTDINEPAPAPAGTSSKIVAASATVAFKADKKKMRKINRAAQRYLRRRDRDEHPEGRTDNAGRWYPAESEKFDASHHRFPSRYWPWSYMTACRTIAHCAMLEGIPELLSEVRKEARRLDRKSKLLNREGVHHEN